jgi:S1-C subfamily serine protease
LRREKYITIINSIAQVSHLLVYSLVVKPWFIKLSLSIPIKASAEISRSLYVGTNAYFHEVFTMGLISQSRLRLLSFAILIGMLLPINVNAKSAVQAEQQFAMGWEAYEQGKFSDALEIWEPLARYGNKDAQINLGVMYDYGKGVTESPEMAARWYQSAAEQGHASAQFNLGQLYLQGRGVEQNIHQAIYWLQQAAYQDFAIAQYNLGVLYAEGKRLPAQYNKAVKWFYQAGLAYLQKGNLDKSRESLQAIQQISPDHSRAVELQAKLISTTPSVERNVPDDIFANKSSGTAWPIANGYAVTNNHVVSGNSKVTLINTDGDSIQARVVLRDEQNDIALLSVIETDKLPPALPLSGSHARLGASVFTIGYPRIDIMGKTPKLTDGIISSVSGLRGDSSNYQISVPVQPGNSGGPLLNMKGEVVGIVTSMLGTTDDSTGATTLLSNISYALKVDVLKALMNQLPESERSLAELSSQNDNLEGLAARIQSSVMIVLAGQ